MTRFGVYQFTGNAWLAKEFAPTQVVRKIKDQALLDGGCIKYDGGVESVNSLVLLVGSYNILNVYLHIKGELWVS